MPAISEVATWREGAVSEAGDRPPDSETARGQSKSVARMDGTGAKSEPPVDDEDDDDCEEEDDDDARWAAAFAATAATAVTAATTPAAAATVAVTKLVSDGIESMNPSMGAATVVLPKWTCAEALLVVATVEVPSTAAIVSASAMDFLKNFHLS